MKILYFGDGKSRNNWGAQATSAALQDMLKEKHTIIGTVISEIKVRPYRVFVGPPFLARFERAISARRNNPLFKPFYNQMVKAGFKENYFDEDVDTALKQFLAIRKYHPEVDKVCRQIEQCDAIVLNGEGTFIFSTPARRDAIFFLLVMKLAKSMGKKVYCLNSMISDCPVNGRNQKTVDQMIEIFRTSDGVTLRDPYSYEFLKQLAPDLHTKYVPDALFTWVSKAEDGYRLPTAQDNVVIYPKSYPAGSAPIDFTKPYICISGSSLAAKMQKEAVPAYTALVERLKATGLQLVIIPTAHGDAFLYEVSERTGVALLPETLNILLGASVLAHARIFVSGRFHPSILASLGGTPCIFMGSNSHKTKSLQDQLGYTEVAEYGAVPSASDVEAIYNDVVKTLANIDERRAQISATVNDLAANGRKIVEFVK